MDPLPGVQVVLGDFTAPHVQAELRGLLAGEVGRGGADTVLSDAAHSFTGEGGTDHTRQLTLAWQALVFACAGGGGTRPLLRQGGSLAIKVRHGEDYAAFRAAVARLFGSMREEKPASSRADSAETYVVGLSFRPEAAAGAGAAEAASLGSRGLPALPEGRPR
jgi:23S rRNA (uridine2552-2'-O)-methyltransferase